MKRGLFLLFFVCSLSFLNAQTVLVDSDEGFPVSYASVLNQDGKFLGLTSVDGLLPELNDAQSISITHIAYEPLKVKVKDLKGELKFKPVQMQLGEAVVATPKTYCFRLTGFVRNYVLTNQLFEDDDPILRFYEGIGDLYIFMKNDKHEWMEIATRDGKTNQMAKKQKGVRLRLGAKSVVETINNSEKVSLRDAQGYRQVIKNDTVIGSLISDEDDRIIRVDIDHLFPDTVRLFNAVVAKLRITELKENFIYQMTDEDYVSQSTLKAYNTYDKYWTKLFGQRFEGNGFTELYVDKAECLSKEEYKEAMKQYKQLRKTSYAEFTSEDLDKYIREHNIPGIPDELLKSLEISRQIQEKNNKK